MVLNQTVSRLLVGNEIRRMREAAGLTQEEAAEPIGVSGGYLSKLELGQTRVRVAEVEKLLTGLGADAQHVDNIANLARGANRRGRWTGHRAAFPEWLRMYVDLEEGAEAIRQVMVEMIPGILQVEPYIRTIHAEWPRTPDDSGDPIENAVAARKERQQIFTRSDPPSVSFVLAESCLHRMVGDPTVMREQLDYLLDISQLHNVQLQILPNRTRTYSGAVSYPFTTLTIGAPGIASPLSFVYVENYDEARYIDDKPAVRRYDDLWNRLTAAALGPTESRDFIHTTNQQYR